MARRVAGLLKKSGSACSGWARLARSRSKWNQGKARNLVGAPRACAGLDRPPPSSNVTVAIEPKNMVKLGFIQIIVTKRRAAGQQPPGTKSAEGERSDSVKIVRGISTSTNS